MSRMNREQFFGQLATFDEKRLKKALWNLYWRGSAATRERIEAEINPVQHDRSTRLSKEPTHPQQVLGEVGDFVARARSGAYLGGDRRVSPRERTRWRFTFQRLVKAAKDALRAEDADDAATAVEQLIDLAREMHGYDYFRSEDPVEAARFVVSDAVALMWGKIRDQHGFPVFAERAAPQLIRWESPYGWTRSGYGRVSEKETSLASVLAPMLPAPDMWAGFTDRYLDALDQVTRDDQAKPNRAWQPTGRDRDQRSADLAEWHRLLVHRLMDSEAEDHLDRLARHPALGGPELGFLQAQLAHQRGDVSSARNLVHTGLQKLPGHQSFLDFATEIGAPLPPRAQQIIEERSRWTLSQAQGAGTS
jgi:hypothetical protein